ncbi:MAG: flagellar assembly protein FliH [Rhodospirillaceae bacterium]|nr:MAG: flagellar assembly protein FliH [Rhodospirillaceae bacterium]
MGGRPEIRKFLFEENFDPEHHSVFDTALSETELELPGEDFPVVPETPPPPTYSEDDLTAARAEGQAAGRTAAQAELNASLAQRQAKTLEKIAATLQNLHQQQTTANEDIAKGAAALAALIVHKLFPVMARDHGADEIVGLCTEMLPHILEQPRLTVRVSPGMAEALRTILSETARNGGFEGRLLITADERIGPADCRIEWGDGGAERNSQKMLEEIKILVGRTIGADLALEEASP